MAGDGRATALWAFAMIQGRVIPPPQWEGRSQQAAFIRAWKLDYEFMPHSQASSFTKPLCRSFVGEIKTLENARSKHFLPDSSQHRYRPLHEGSCPLYGTVTAIALWPGMQTHTNLSTFVLMLGITDFYS